MRPPSGEQFTIAYGEAQATICQVGATLRTLSIGGRDVIDGFAVDQRAMDGRGQVLAPWPNRLTDGVYTYGGRDHQVPLNEVSRNDAIHGLVRWLDWSLVSHDAPLVKLACTMRPQPGYEWQLDLEITYSLGDGGLTVSLEAVNVDSETAPFGAGFHPYLTLGNGSDDSLTMKVPALEYLDGEEMSPVTATQWDFTAPRPIGSTKLDTCFGGLVRDDEGRAVARLEDGNHCVELWVDDAYRYLMVYTADAVGAAERRRTAVAIEPMTCPPDAFRSGTALHVLEPGRSLETTWGIAAG
jgi:aldose 1-epimerase